MPIVVAILVSWTFYGLGALTLVRCWRPHERLRPVLVDLILVTGIMICGAILVRSQPGWLSLLLNAFVSFLLGFLAKTLPPNLDESGLAGEYSDQAAEEKKSAHSAWVKAWRGWGVLANSAFDFQVRILFAFTYLIFMWPWALAYRLFSDPLTRRAPANTQWQRASLLEESVSRARDQY